jgi:hypothetical protein
MTAGEKRPELPTDAGRHLGVEECKRAHSSIPDQGVSGDQATTVVSDDGDVVEAEEIDRSLDARDVSLNGEIRLCRELARSGTGQIDQMARDVINEVGKQGAKSRATHRPTMDEENIGTGADPAIGNFGVADIEEPRWLLSEEVGCSLAIDAHGTTPFVVVATRG